MPDNNDMANEYPGSYANLRKETRLMSAPKRKKRTEGELDLFDDARNKPKKDRHVPKGYVDVLYSKDK